MVQFGKTFREQQRGEWSAHYCDYKKLKRSIRLSLQLQERYNRVGTYDLDLGGEASPAVDRILALSRKVRGAAKESPVLNLFIKRRKKSSDEATTSTLSTSLPNVVSVSASASLSSPLLSNDKDNLGEMLVDNAASAERGLSSQLEAGRSPAYVSESAFPAICEREIRRVDAFHAETLEVLEQSVGVIEEQCTRALGVRGCDPSQCMLDPGTEDPAKLEPAGNKKSERSLRGALMDRYREANHLINFGVLNHLAFVKAVKKARKRLLPGGAPESLFSKLDDALAHAEFSSRLAPRRIAERIEKQYANCFYGGNTETAKYHLLMRQHSVDSVGNWDAFRLGLRVGMVVLLVLWMLWDCIVDSVIHPGDVCEPGIPIPGTNTTMEYSFWGDPVIHVYKFSAAAIMGVWCIGLLLLIWRRARVNVMYIFDLSPGTSYTRPDEVFRTATNLTAIGVVNFLVFFKIHRGDFFAKGSRVHTVNRWLPFILFVATILGMVFPWRRRRGLWVTIGRLFTAPLHGVTFWESYVADVFTSLVKVLADLSYSFCFYASGSAFDACPSYESYCKENFALQRICLPLLAALPLLIRFCQCLRMYSATKQRFPHLANGFKYCFAQSVVLFGALHFNVDTSQKFTTVKILWISSYALSTLYTYLWDVLMDWGLSMSWSKFQMLRKRRMISVVRWPYYSAMVADFFLRFLWTVSLVPASASVGFGVFLHDKIVPWLGFIEIFRRSMWSVFRLENEHLNNTSGYRRSKYVPLHFDEHSRQKSVPKKRVRPRDVALEITLIVLAAVAVGVLAALTRK